MLGYHLRKILESMRILEACTLYTLEDWHGTYKSPIVYRKENDLNQTSMRTCSMLVFRGVRGCFLVAQMSSAFLCDFFGFGQEAIVDVFCSRSSPRSGLEHSTSEHPKKNTKYLRTSKCGFCRHDVVFFPRVCYTSPLFCFGGRFLNMTTKLMIKFVIIYV